MKRMALVSAAAAIGLTGCSVLFMETEPKYSPKREPRCSASIGWPLWDSFIAIANGTTATVLLMNVPGPKYLGDPTPPAHDQVITAGVVGLVAAALYTGSAIAGYRWVGKCTDARAAHDNYVPPDPAEQDAERARREDERKRANDEAARREIERIHNNNADAIDAGSAAPVEAPRL